jgi:hypothetical protein
VIGPGVPSMRPIDQDKRIQLHNRKFGKIVAFQKKCLGKLLALQFGLRLRSYCGHTACAAK